MTRSCLLIVLLAALTGAPAPAQGPSRNSLDVYFIDVEGGQATLFVTPAGQSMLVDTGFPGERDATRIAETAAAAGLKQIDYLVITHYHTDHVGGAAPLAAKLPIVNFVDHGPNVEPPPTTGRGAGQPRPYDVYVALRSKSRHLQVAPGDTVPLAGADVTVLAAAGKAITRPLARAASVAAANRLCASFEAKDEAANIQLRNENAASVGTLVEFGQFSLLNLGDLTWNREHLLACPRNLIGTVDVYLTTHHGQDISGLPQLVHAVAPRVAVMNNGARKGGAATTFQSLRRSPGLVDLWQLHQSIPAGAAHNSPEAFIANLDETTAHAIKVSARRDGSFTVTNGRTGVVKAYAAGR